MRALLDHLVPERRRSFGSIRTSVEAAADADQVGLGDPVSPRDGRRHDVGDR